MYLYNTITKTITVLNKEGKILEAELKKTVKGWEVTFQDIKSLHVSKGQAIRYLQKSK